MQTGGYEFMATFPGVYSKRPILHYHVMVSSCSVITCNLYQPMLQISTPGARGRTFITQIYFRDHVPRWAEGYVRTRESQYGHVTPFSPAPGSSHPPGRLVQFNIRLNV